MLWTKKHSEIGSPRDVKYEVLPLSHNIRVFFTLVQRNNPDLRIPLKLLVVIKRKGGK